MHFSLCILIHTHVLCNFVLLQGQHNCQLIISYWKRSKLPTGKANTPYAFPTSYPKCLLPKIPSPQNSFIFAFCSSNEIMMMTMMMRCISACAFLYTHTCFAISFCYEGSIIANLSSSHIGRDQNCPTDQSGSAKRRVEPKLPANFPLHVPNAYFPDSQAP